MIASPPSSVNFKHSFGFFGHSIVFTDLSTLMNFQIFQLQRTMIKWGVSSWWSFGPNNTWGSLETTTIGNTHPTLLFWKTTSKRYSVGSIILADKTKWLLSEGVLQHCTDVYSLENLPNEKTVKTILNSAAQIMCRPSGEKNAWSTPTKPASIVHSHFGLVKSKTWTLLLDDNTARINDESELQLKDVILSTVVKIVL